MRVNIYAEELTREVKPVSKQSDTGNVFLGIRFFLESSDQLHFNKNDDDRSAITFWVPGSMNKRFRPEMLIESFEQAIATLKTFTQLTENFTTVCQRIIDGKVCGKKHTGSTQHEAFTNAMQCNHIPDNPPAQNTEQRAMAYTAKYIENECNER